jgi:hypothetical protein
LGYRNTVYKIPNNCKNFQINKNIFKIIYIFIEFVQSKQKMGLHQLLINFEITFLFADFLFVNEQNGSIFLDER